MRGEVAVQQEVLAVRDDAAIKATSLESILQQTQPMLQETRKHLEIVLTGLFIDPHADNTYISWREILVAINSEIQAHSTEPTVLPAMWQSLPSWFSNRTFIIGPSCRPMDVATLALKLWGPSLRQGGAEPAYLGSEEVLFLLSSLAHIAGNAAHTKLDLIAKVLDKYLRAIHPVPVSAWKQSDVCLYACVVMAGLAIYALKFRWMAPDVVDPRDALEACLEKCPTIIRRVLEP